MIAIAFLFVCVLCASFKSRRRLEAEILILWHQLNVRRHRTPRRLHLRWVDRALFIWLYRRKGAALVLPSCNTEAMALHLEEIATAVAPGAHAKRNPSKSKTGLEGTKSRYE